MSKRQIMSRNNSNKMSRQYFDDSNQNISVIDRKQASVEFYHKNSSEIISENVPVQFLAEIYQAPADDQVYNEVLYEESSACQEREDTPHPEVINEELYSEIVEVAEDGENVAMNVYSTVRKD